MAIDAINADGVVEKAEASGSSEISPLKVMVMMRPEESRLPDTGYIGQESGAGSLVRIGTESHINQVVAPF